MCGCNVIKVEDVSRGKLMKRCSINVLIFTSWCALHFGLLFIVLSQLICHNIVVVFITINFYLRLKCFMNAVKPLQWRQSTTWEHITPKPNVSVHISNVLSLISFTKIPHKAFKEKKSNWKSPCGLHKSPSPINHYGNVLGYGINTLNESLVEIWKSSHTDSSWEKCH